MRDKKCSTKQRVATTSKHYGQKKEKPNERKRERGGTNNDRATSNGKRARLNEDRELASLTAKINGSEEAMVKLKAHIKKETCPKSLRYNSRANIAPDEDFKKDISAIRKKAEQAVVGALVRFHQRRVDRLVIKKKKVEQTRSRNKNSVTNVTKSSASHKTHSVARESNVHTDVNQLAKHLQDQISKVNKMMLELNKATKNKEGESYPRVLPELPRLNNRGTTRNRKTESRKRHIKNLSKEQLTNEQINLLSRGLKFIPTPATRENLIRRQLLNDFEQFARRMRLQYIFHRKDNNPHPFHVRSDWIPPVQPSVALEIYLEKIKIELAEINVSRPKDNLPQSERNALTELMSNKNIVLKKADKGTTTVVMDREDKLAEGQSQLNDRKDYQPLAKPMVDTTSIKVRQLIKSLEQEGHIDKMTEKWLSLTPNPPRIPAFYTLTKIHKPTLVGRPIISGCDGPTERISSFVDRLIQPIAQMQDSYLKDTTDFISFIETKKFPANTILVSMDVTSLYTNIPQEEGINTVCQAYEDYHNKEPPIPVRYLREMLSLI